MLPARKIHFEVKKKEKENLRFRSFLKCNADEEELDQQFLQLHKELFENFDCGRCRNCCKEYCAELTTDEVKEVAEYLKMEEPQFVQTYLEKDETEGTYLTKNKPCDFLQKNGECLLEECKPDGCKKYPYTDQSGRLGSLYGMLDAIAVCPVAYEIWERLKKIYNFH